MEPRLENESLRGRKPREKYPKSARIPLMLQEHDAFRRAVFERHTTMGVVESGDRRVPDGPDAGTARDRSRRHEPRSTSNMTDYTDFERKARVAIEKHLGIELPSREININGKQKKLDLVNESQRIVGDVKRYKNTKSGNTPSAKFSILNEYCWIMQMVEKYSRTGHWRKLLVVGEDRDMLEKYRDSFNAWLADIEIYYYSRESGLEKIRG